MYCDEVDSTFLSCGFEYKSFQFYQFFPFWTIFLWQADTILKPKDKLNWKELESSD